MPKGHPANASSKGRKPKPLGLGKKHRHKAKNLRRMRLNAGKEIGRLSTAEYDRMTARIKAKSGQYQERLERAREIQERRQESLRYKENFPLLLDERYEEIFQLSYADHLRRETSLRAGNGQSAVEIEAEAIRMALADTFRRTIPNSVKTYNRFIEETGKHSFIDFQNWIKDLIEKK